MARWEADYECQQLGKAKKKLFGNEYGRPYFERK